MRFFLFGLYAYVEHLFWGVCGVLPYPARHLLLRLVLKRLGYGSMIDYATYIRYPWKVSIGKGSQINRGCELYTSFHVKDAEIVIGDDVAIGPDVKIFSAGHGYDTLKLSDIAATIRIHDHAWIGGGTIVLPGVEIGEGAVVGSGSVVTRSIPPYSIAVGKPARIIKPRFSQKDSKQNFEED